jgi:hypothetical protein
MIYTLFHLMDSVRTIHRRLADGRWVPARPVGGPSWWRVKAAWSVLSGKADAVVWPEDEE